MNLKIYLPMGEKPPDDIGRSFIASQYPVHTAPSFIQTSSLQVVWQYLTKSFESTSPSGLVAVILCHAAKLPQPTPLGYTTTVSTMTHPLPACPLTFILFFAATMAVGHITDVTVATSTEVTPTAAAPLITQCLVTLIAVADATTASPPAVEVATLIICILPAAATIFTTTAPLLIVNCLAAAHVTTAAANAPPTTARPTFAISFVATVPHTTAAIDHTPTASLPTPIHLVVRAPAAYKGPCHFSPVYRSFVYCSKGYFTVCYNSSIHSHPICYSQSPSEHCTLHLLCLLTDSTPSRAPNIAPDTFIDISCCSQCNHAVAQHQPIPDCSMVIMFNFLHVSFHIATITHDNSYPLDCPVRLLSHVIAWTARYSAPFSIYDGAIVIIAQPGISM